MGGVMGKKNRGQWVRLILGQAVMLLLRSRLGMTTDPVVCPFLELSTLEVSSRTTAGRERRREMNAPPKRNLESREIVLFASP